MNNTDCIKCEYCRPFNDQDGRNYLGCRYGLGLHQCVWIAKLEDCPKKQKEQEEHKIIALLLDSIETARIYAGAIGEIHGNNGDKEKLIVFFTTRDILADLEANLEKCLKLEKVDSK